MNYATKSLSIFIAIFVLCIDISYCQDSTSHASAALELFSMMNMEKNLAQIVDVMLAAQSKAVPDFKQYEDVMRTFFGKYMGWSYLKDKYLALYTGEFTEGELRGMIEFYKTDIGKKAIEKLPILFAKGSEIGQKAIQEHMPEYIEAIQNREKELNRE